VERFDVLAVAPGGLRDGDHLARAARVVLAEKARFPRDKSC